MGQSLNLALEHQEELGLNQDQVAQLQELKAVLDEDVAGLVEEVKVLREQIRAGEVDRDEGFRRVEALRGELITASAPLRGRVQEILTVEQHSKLQPLVWQGRSGLGRGAAARGGRVGVVRGRGALGGRGMAGRMGVRMQPGGIRGARAPRQGVGLQGWVPGVGFRRAPAGFWLHESLRPIPRIRRDPGTDTTVPIG
jgi:hypothetical protein